MSTARSRFRSAFVLALLAPVLASCSREPGAALVLAPVERATTVVVHDALDAPVTALSVFALHLDGVEVIAAPTDATGAARFTLVAGRWAVSATLSPGSGPAQVAGSTGTVRGAGSGLPDTVLYRLRLAPESVASGDVRLAGRLDHSGTLVSIDELPGFARTDQNGAWRLTALPPGIWTGLAIQPGFKIGVFDIIIPAPADTVVLADTALLQPSGPPGPARWQRRGRSARTPPPGDRPGGSIRTGSR